MSQRTYVSPDERTSVLIESIGASGLNDEGETVWSVTVQIPPGLKFRSLQYTSEVKELVETLEKEGWKKEKGGEETTAEKT